MIGDLELAAKYTVKSSIQQLLNELKSSNHVLVAFTNPELKDSFNRGLEQSDYTEDPTNQSCMIFVPYEFSKDKTQIIRLLFIISEKSEFDNSSLSRTNSSVKSAQPKEKCTPKKSNPVRRLSSSNSFFDMHTENQCHTYLHKLNRMANMGNLSEQPTTPTSNTLNSPFTILPASKLNGYLLYLKLPRETKEVFQWEGTSIQMYASLPVKKSLYQHRNYGSHTSANLILVTSKQSILNEKRIEVKSKLKGTITLKREKTSFHPNIEEAIDELKDSILDFRRQTVDCIRSIEKDLKNSVHFDNASKSHQHTIIDQRYLSEIWRVSYNLGIDLLNECIKFMTQDRAEVFALCLSEFSIMWCNYILHKTERGQGILLNLTGLLVRIPRDFC